MRPTLLRILRLSAAAALCVMVIPIRWAVSAQPFGRFVYVLDTARRDESSRVLKVDEQTGQVVRTFTSGYQPDLALSMSDTRLHVTYSTWQRDKRTWDEVMDIYDTRSGEKLASVPNPHDLRYTGMRYPSKMTTSPSTAVVYVLKNHQRPFDDAYLAAFDARTMAYSERRASLFGCLDALVVPGMQEYDVQVVCTHERLLRRFSLLAGNSVVQTTVSLPFTGARVHHRPGLVVPQQTGALVIFSDKWMGARVEPGLATAQPANAGSLASRKTSGQVALRHGQSAYVASAPGGQGGSGLMDQIHRIDAVTLEVYDTVQSPVPFYHLSMSPDGAHLYAIAPEAKSLIVFETATMKQLRSVPLPATYPTLGVAGRW